MSSAVARQVRLLIGGLDFSDCFVAYGGARTTADTSGLLSISGSLDLTYVPGKTPESLDDRQNPSRWFRGQEITIDIRSEADAWERFPHGALRLLDAEFDGRGRLALKVGDLIAYGNFSEATDYRDAGIDPPNFSTASAIANNLLAKMGLGPMVGALGGFAVNYPIDVGDKYWQTIGELAFSAGRYVYIDRFEQVRSVPMRCQPGAADLSLTVGSAEIDYRRLTGAQKPPEKITVAGTRKIVTENTAYTVSVSDELGPSYLLGGNSAAPILLSQTTIIDDWQPNDDRRRITTTKREARKLINPNESSSPATLQTSLIETADYHYEEPGTGDDDKAKLLRIETDRRAPRIIAIAPYENGWQSAPYTLADYQTETTSFEYNEEAVTAQRRTIKEDTAANIVLDENWDSSPNSPFTLHTNKDELTEWFETIPELEWEETTTTRQSLASQSAEGQEIPSGIGFNAKLGLQTTGVERITSNHGVRPPAADRRPPEFSVIEKPFTHELNLPQPGGSYRAKPVTVQIPFLPGEVGEAVSLKRRRRVFSFNSLAWPKFLGKLFGALLIGRYKGSELSLPYSDAIGALEPMSVIDVSEPLFEGGTVTRSYVIDGDAYALTPEENRCGFDLIWLGDRTGISGTITVTNPDGSSSTQTVDLAKPPYEVPSNVTANGASFSRWNSYGYDISGGGTNATQGAGASAGLWASSATVVQNNVVAGTDNVVAGPDNVVT